MHALGAVDLRICLEHKNHGYAISAQSYDFCPHLRKLDINDFTLSHTQTVQCFTLTNCDNQSKDTEVSASAVVAN